jgi:hypothetical protein
MAGDKEEAHALQRRVNLGGDGSAGLLVTAEPRREVDHRNRRLHDLAPISPPRLLAVVVARS